mgnify:CR=1 FL=1
MHISEVLSFVTFFLVDTCLPCDDASSVVALEILMITFKSLKSVEFTLCLSLDRVTFRHRDGAL